MYKVDLYTPKCLYKIFIKIIIYLYIINKIKICVSLKTKNKEFKQLTGSSGITELS